jgi:anti-sigma factor RsiW
MPVTRENDIMTAPPFSDEDLTAYLDGEASDTDRRRIDAAKTKNPKLRARLAKLTIDTAAIRDAFNTMPAPAFRAPQKKSVAQTNWWKTAAAVALAFGVGLLSSQFTPRAQGWQQQAASYHELYSTNTLAGLSPAPQEQQQQLAMVSQAIGREMSVAQVNAGPDFEFKRAQLLGYANKPLVQIAYTSKSGAPFALCIYADNYAKSAQPEFDRMGQVDTATWSDGTRTYLVLGGGTQDDLRKLTGQLFAQL